MAPQQCTLREQETRSERGKKGLFLNQPNPFIKINKRENNKHNREKISALRNEMEQAMEMTWKKGAGRHQKRTRNIF